MNSVSEIAKVCGFEIIHFSEDIAIEGCYCGDLLSRVMVGDIRGKAWMTVMNNINVIAVAVATGASCVILTEGVLPDDNMLAKAKEHGVNLFSSKLDSFSAALALHGMLG